MIEMYNIKYNRNKMYIMLFERTLLVYLFSSYNNYDNIIYNINRIINILSYLIL